MFQNGKILLKINHKPKPVSHSMTHLSNPTVRQTTTDKSKSGSWTSLSKQSTASSSSWPRLHNPFSSQRIKKPDPETKELNPTLRTSFTRNNKKDS